VQLARLLILWLSLTRSFLNNAKRAFFTAWPAYNVMKINSSASAISAAILVCLNSRTYEYHHSGGTGAESNTPNNDVLS